MSARREALEEMLPRYCEMFAALGLGNPSTESVAVEIANEALAAPAAGGEE